MFRTPWKVFQILPFPKNVCQLSDDFFNHWLQILKFPLPIFAVSVHSPSSEKLLFPNTFANSPHWFRKIFGFLNTFCVFPFPPTCSLTMMHLFITQCTYWTPLFKTTALDANACRLIVDNSAYVILLRVRLGNRARTCLVCDEAKMHDRT